MTLLYESMTRIQWGGWTIRIWRKRQPKTRPIVVEIQRLLDKLDPAKISDEQLASKLIRFKSINAVEVVDRSAGNGTVVYKDWP